MSEALVSVGGADKSKDLTALIGDIKIGKTALVNGDILTGTLSTAAILGTITSGNIISTTKDGGDTTVNISIDVVNGTDYIVVAHIGGFYNGTAARGYYIGKIVGDNLSMIAAQGGTASKSGTKVTVYLPAPLMFVSSIIFAIPIVL